MTDESPSTVSELLGRRADDDTLGVIDADGQWSWREAVAAATAVGDWLQTIPGEGPFHVGVLMENTPAHLFTILGSAQAGATVVGLNTTRRGTELARDISHTDCRLVVTDAASAPLLAEVDLDGTPVIQVDRDGIPLRDDARRREDDASAVTADDLFLLLFTSGSTGAPKAVRMTHGRAARMANSSTWFSSDDVLYNAMPLFHGNAMNATVLPALSTGATIALRHRFSASEFLPDLRRFGATFFSTVGRALSYILAVPDSDDDREHAVKWALAPESSPADIRAFRHRFGITCITGYGSSENAIILTPGAGMPKDALGFPQEGADIAVVDPTTGDERPRARFDDAGRIINADEAIGEIVGRNVADRFEGYWNNPEAEAERTRFGWYWSGDLGYRDEGGVFFFAGRSGEWLRVDSENFAAAPVERILGRFDSASGVAVYAVPDDRTADDQVMATIELADGATFDPVAFDSFVTDQPDLSPHWVPRFLHIGTLPVGATNKIDKRPLRAARWWTGDPVWWRPSRGDSYRPFTADDLTELEARFRAHGRDPRRP